MLLKSLSEFSYVQWGQYCMPICLLGWMIWEWNDMMNVLWKLCSIRQTWNTQALRYANAQADAQDTLDLVSLGIRYKELVQVVFILVFAISAYQDLNSHAGFQTLGLITKFSHHYTSRYFRKGSTVFILYLLLSWKVSWTLSLLISPSAISSEQSHGEGW